MRAKSDFYISQSETPTNVNIKVQIKKIFNQNNEDH
jgi:hypothetical protein